MSEQPNPKKGRKKWLIAALVALAAVVEVVGPRPVSQAVTAVVQGLLGGLQPDEPLLESAQPVHEQSSL